MISVLVVGIGGASLGTEIAKCLRLAGGYRIVGCDIAPLAFGHYSDLFDETHLVDTTRYIDDVLELCTRHEVRCIIPGGEQPTQLLSDEEQRVRQAGVVLAVNRSEAVAQIRDKARCFSKLAALGFAIPRTASAEDPEVLAGFPTPCVIKPALESGGSSFVFVARDRGEAEVYTRYLASCGKHPIVQEYIPLDGGEFTVGVLSDPDGTDLGVVALKRAFPAKLSVAIEGDGFLISSGYSQGQIDDYAVVCDTARAIATALGSRGPLNVQGRVDSKGDFLPFEINARFSASTYLRALAGFNEVDHYIKLLLDEPITSPLDVRPGWYLRSLDEVAIPPDGLIG
jgi:carbamoyl-phosphate synthase large subunit